MAEGNAEKDIQYSIDNPTKFSLIKNNRGNNDDMINGYVFHRNSTNHKTINYLCIVKRVDAEGISNRCPASTSIPFDSATK